MQFDYEQNLVLVGVNMNGLAAESRISFDPEGRDTREKPVPRYYYEPLVNLVIWLLVLALIALLIYVKKHKAMSRTADVAAAVDAKEYQGSLADRLTEK